MALLYFVPVFAHNFVFACTRCDAEHDPPVRLKLLISGRPTLALGEWSMACSLFPKRGICRPVISLAWVPRWMHPTRDHARAQITHVRYNPSNLKNVARLTSLRQD